MNLSRRDLGLGLASLAALAGLPAQAQANPSAEDRAALARAQAYLQAHERRCRRSLSSRELRQAMETNSER